MTTLHAGTFGFDRPRDQYTRRLKFVELPLRSPFPPPKKTNLWRKEAGEDFVFALSVPESFWGEPEFPLKDPVHTRAEVDRLQNMISSLKPEILVFRTPLSVRPGSAAFERFRTLCVDRLQKMATVIVWEPTGIWERETAVKLMADLANVLVAADPLHDDVSEESHVYARMRGLGVDSRYHASKLEDLLAAIEHCDEAWVVFETPSGFKEATTLLALHNDVDTDGPAYTSEEDDEDEDLDEDEDEDEDEDLDEDEDDGDDGDETE
jgi:uncharacterized protein YecE (DUF72 family)